MRYAADRGWGAARYGVPKGLHRAALALALAAPVIGLLVIRLA
jgi:hypothetical protein